MKVVIAGGRLQGVEAAYLAGELGWESVVVDKDEQAPASGICTRFVCGDVRDGRLMAGLCSGADLLLPAIEKRTALDALEHAALANGLPLVYDRAAYGISSNKLCSDKLFAELGVPAPLPWPECGLPVLCKPSEGSGSRGVAVLRTPEEVRGALEEAGSGQLVLQQYLTGPSYSVEVVGNGRAYAALQVTQLFMDREYDCKRVLAPSGLTPDEEKRFRETALRIARALCIRGIFDVEAIYCGGEFHILEIDARLPSQTPTAVCHSSGVNMLELLLRTARGASPSPSGCVPRGACLYEHVHIRGGKAVPCGEHVMGRLGRLRVEKGFYGADTALVGGGAEEWAATLIFCGPSRTDALRRHRAALREIRKAINR